MSIINNVQMNIVRATISDIFAMPERDQSAAWVDVIEFTEQMIAADRTEQGRAASIEAKGIYISIAKEAKFFG